MQTVLWENRSINYFSASNLVKVYDFSALLRLTLSSINSIYDMKMQPKGAVSICSQFDPHISECANRRKF